jgi:hypothetical protein
MNESNANLTSKTNRVIAVRISLSSFPSVGLIRTVSNVVCSASSSSSSGADGEPLPFPLVGIFSA